MATQETSKGAIMLNNVRLAFPQVFTAKAVQDGGEPRFSASFLMAPNHPDVVRIKQVLQLVAQEKWDDQAAAVLKQLVAQDRVCLHSGDTKADYDGFPGNLYVSANAKVRPLVIGKNRSPLTEEDGVIYAGCYVNAKIDIWAQANQYGKRLNAQLQGIQFVADGDAFAGGGRTADPDEFADLADVDSADEFPEGAANEGGDDAFGDLL